MSKKNYYIAEKNIEKIIKGKNTNFLDPNTLKKICSKLKNKNYKIFSPFKESERVIIYTKQIPKIELLEIKSNDKLTHREIMGSIFSLNIDFEFFGDILITNNKYYIIIMSSIHNLLIKEYKMIGNKKIKLIKAPFDILYNYTIKYEAISLIVSSLRIDTIICRLIGEGRDSIKKKFIDNEIVLNHEICHKLNNKLKIGDIFSIRRYGKYKFSKIIKNTKKGNYIIEIFKYIDN